MLKIIRKNRQQTREQYYRRLETFHRMQGQYRRYGVDVKYTPVKYKRNISPVSLGRLEYAISKLASLGKAAKKKRARERRKEKQKKHIISIVSTPTAADMQYAAIMKMLDNAPVVMSAKQSFYNPMPTKHNGRRLAEHNAIRIKDIIENARVRLFEKFLDDGETSAIAGREATREIVRRLQKYYRGRDIIYELERLAYGLYDRQYSSWGGGSFLLELEMLQNALQGGD